ncbi:hypothetical protein [Bifidobacterium bombi]|nr:hypothetical protein [Bifidobacterium bombi]
MGLDSESRVADGAVTLDGDLSVAADEANREFDVFYERGLFASVGDARVLAGPFDVRLDYGAFRSAFHVASDLYWRKSGLVFVVLCWWLVPVFLFDLDSLRGESFGSKVAVFSFLAMLAIAVWFVLRPPSMLGLRDSKAARDFFCIHGADMEAWNPGPKKWYNDPADHSMSVRVQVRVTELGVEELAGGREPD